MTADDPQITQRDLTHLRESLVELKSAIQGLRGEINTTYVRKDVLNPTIQGLREDVDKHSEWFTWATRIVIGAVILGLLAVVIQTGGTS